jgi:hypothetical protein
MLLTETTLLMSSARFQFPFFFFLVSCFLYLLLLAAVHTLKCSQYLLPTVKLICLIEQEWSFGDKLKKAHFGIKLYEWKKER